MLVSLWSRLQQDGLLSLLAKGATGSLAVALVATGLGFVVQAVLARVLGVSQFGVYIYTLTWINTLLLLTTLGLDGSLVRYIPAYRTQREWGLLRGVLRWSLTAVFFASLFVGAVIFLVTWLLENKISTDLQVTFWVGIALLPLLSLTIVRQAALRGFKHAARSEIPDTIFRSLIILFLVGIFYYIIQQPISAWHAMMFNLVGAVIAFIIGGIWLMRVLPIDMANNKEQFAHREWLRVSIPMMLISAMNLILEKADVLMLGILINTEQAGIYAISARVSELALFGLSAVNAIAAPMISEYFNKDAKQELQRTVKLAARGITAFTVVVIVFVLIFGKFILGLFGDEFISGYVPLLILLTGNAVIALGGTVGFVMTMTGYQNQAATIVAVCAVFNLILNSLLIPSFGLNGAAIATVTTSIMMISSMLIYVWRKLSINASAF